jgi:hypothetical protein
MSALAAVRAALATPMAGGLWGSPRRQGRPYLGIVTGRLGLVGLAGLGILSLALLTWAASAPSGLRIGLMICTVCLMLGVGAISARALLLLLIVWLAALGFVRRYTTLIDPDKLPERLAGSLGLDADVLLLVGPTAVLALLVVSAARGAFQDRSALSSAILALCVLMVAGAFNPHQGSVLAGLSGLLFILVPVLYFWIGRHLCDDRTMWTVVVLVGALSLGAAAYGHFQTFSGFPSWDQAWIDETVDEYAALQVGETIRPFSSFSASADYTHFIALGVIAFIAIARRRRWLVVSIAALPVLLAAVFFSSQRGAFVLLVAAIALVVAALRRARISVAVAVGAAIVLLIPLVAGQFAPKATGEDIYKRGLADHLLAGLADPLDPDDSTLLEHWELVVDGMRTSINEPLGLGVSTVNIAGSKFGGRAEGTEQDPSNLAVALGLPGFALYLAVFALAFRLTYGLARERRDPLSVFALGALMVTLFQWFNGGHYAVSLLPWLVLGWADASRRREARAASAAEVRAPEPPAPEAVTA